MTEPAYDTYIEFDGGPHSYDWRTTMEEAKFELIGGRVRIWIEQEAIHMRVRELEYNDAAEITGFQARQIAAALIGMAEKIGE